MESSYDIWTSVPKGSNIALIAIQFNLAVRFQLDPGFPEMAMSRCLPKLLKVRHPKESCSLPEAFLFWGVSP